MGRLSDILKNQMGIDAKKSQKSLTSQENDYWRQVNQPIETAPEHYSQKEVIRRFQIISKKINPDFKIDKNNKSLIEFLCLYFSKDKLMSERFPKYSIHKGLFIVGNCGTGKTQMMKIFKEVVKYLPTQAFFMTSTNQVVRDFDSSGSDSLTPYIDRKYCFDDFGSENQAKHYGKSEEVFKTILEDRYNKFIDNGLKTYITSNLNLLQVKQRYGDRVNSRLFEMFNIIVLEGNDRRI